MLIRSSHRTLRSRRDRAFFKKRRLRTRVIKKIEEIPSEEFNKIFPHVPERYHFLKTLDESGFDQFSFYYILVYERKESGPPGHHAGHSSLLIGAAPCFTINYSLDTSVNGPLRRLTNTIKKIFPNLFNIKALVCGIPMGQGQIGTAGGSSAVLEAIEERMEALARKIHAPLIAFKDFDQSYDKLFLPLLKNGFLKIDGLPMTRMVMDFSNFEEYLKTLNSDNRHNFRKKIKKAMLANFTHSITGSLDETTLNEVYSLYLQVVETHDMGFEIVPKKFFHLISQNMPKETKFFLWRINGKLAAFTFCLVLNDVLIDYYLGFDYTYAYEYHLFFIKFQKILNWCLDHGIKTYEMGTTGYDGKRRLGFDFVPVYLYVKIRCKIIRPFLKCLCALLKFENFDPELKRWKRSQK